MSGGRYDYAYSNVKDFAESLDLTSPLRKAFKKHLKLVADAMWAIEWNDSGDGADNEETLIAECLGKTADMQALNILADEAQKLINEMNDCLAKAQVMIQ